MNEVWGDPIKTLMLFYSGFNSTIELENSMEM